MEKGGIAFTHEPLARQQAKREERLQLWRRVAIVMSLSACCVIAYFGHRDVQHRAAWRLALLFPLGLYLRFLTIYSQRKKELRLLNLSELREIERMGQANFSIDEAIARWRSEHSLLRYRDFAACHSYASKNISMAELKGSAVE